MNEFSFKWKLSDLEKVEQNNYKVFSTFSGAGGSSMGYKMAGFDVVGCCEIDPKQLKMYKKNLNPKYVYQGDIRKLLEEVKKDGIPEELKKLDVFDGSPPCTLFSSANITADENKGKAKKFAEGQEEQILDELFSVTISLIKELQPKIVILENVLGLMFKKNEKYIHEIYTELEESGYKVTHGMINMLDCGVPQQRKRVFFFGVREDIKVETSDLLNKSPKWIFNFNHRHLRLKDIDQDGAGGLLKGKYLPLLEKYYDKCDGSIGDMRDRWGLGRGGFNNRLYHQASIIGTLRSKNDAMKLNKDGKWEKFSKAELVQIQSFPTDYDFGKGNYCFALGMSVPPLGMYKIAKEIEKLLDKN